MAGSSQFPKGLRVLLVDEQHSAASIRTQLESPSLQYTVTSVTSGSEALGYLRTGVAAFDVVLAESRIVAGDEAVGRSFVDAFEDTPVVLMSSCSTPGDVMRAVQLGAVDFLDKPLSHLKLKNIWQHSVRKMMLKAAGPRVGCTAACHAPAAPFSSWISLPASLANASAASLGAPESPSTPSALSGGDLPETFSVCSDGASMRNSLDMQSGTADGSSFMDAMTSALGAPPSPAAARPTCFAALLAAPLAGGATSAPAAWPQLHSGCVWGTPANGPVPPPMPGAGMAATPTAAPMAPPPSTWGSAPVLQHPPSPKPPVLIKHSASAVVLPVVATHDDIIIPEGFFSDSVMGGKSTSGPLGLQLKKSASLLNLINSALGSSDSLNGLAAMIC